MGGPHPQAQLLVRGSPHRATLLLMRWWYKVANVMVVQEKPAAPVVVAYVNTKVVCELWG